MTEQKETPVTSEASGKYVKFELSEGEYFRVDLAEKEALPFWAWLLIGIAISVGAVGLAVLIIFLVRKGKKDKTAPTVTDKEEIKAEEITEG